MGLILFMASSRSRTCGRQRFRNRGTQTVAAENCPSRAGRRPQADADRLLREVFYDRFTKLKPFEHGQY